jgi:hypothetical protein
MVDGVNIVDGRIDRAGHTRAVSELPDHTEINHIAIRVAATVDHEQY